jgi:hypothetical protein
MWALLRQRFDAVKRPLNGLRQDEARLRGARYHHCLQRPGTVQSRRGSHSVVPADHATEIDGVVPCGNRSSVRLGQVCRTGRQFQFKARGTLRGIRASEPLVDVSESVAVGIIALAAGARELCCQTRGHNPIRVRWPRYPCCRGASPVGAAPAGSSRNVEDCNKWHSEGCLNFWWASGKIHTRQVEAPIERATPNDGHAAADQDTFQPGAV